MLTPPLLPGDFVYVPEWGAFAHVLEVVVLTGAEVLTSALVQFQPYRRPVCLTDAHLDLSHVWRQQSIVFDEV